MKEEVFTIRKMEAADIAGGLKLSTQEGWNQTVNDWCQLISPPNDSFVLIVDDRVVATMTVVNYSNIVAWIGMVLVDRVYRRRGYAALLLATCFDTIQTGAAYKLDATAAGLRVYEKVGFIAEYQIIRMTLHSAVAVLSNKTHQVVRRVSAGDLDAITRLDSIVFGAKRGDLIHYLAEQDHGGWLIEDAGQLTGFALGRLGNQCFQLGPVTAGCDLEATTLLAAGLSYCRGQAVVIDIMADKTVVIEWLSAQGFSRQRNFTRMYKNTNPPAAVQFQYCVCGPEFG